jgi:hypothetical protein
VGTSTCTSPAPCFYFTTRLVARGGAVLDEFKNTNVPQCGMTGWHDWPTGEKYCANMYVHSFFYMNVNGAGSSVTSGERACF